MKNNLLLFTTCLGIGIATLTLVSKTGYTQEPITRYYYQLSEEEYRKNHIEWRRFIEYHVHREPCQSYVAPPAGYIVRDCEVYRVNERAETTQAVIPARFSERQYTVYFDFDQSNIRENERQNLADIAEELRRINVYEVTVMAHTDRHGTAGYNQKLSERRAHTVGKALAAYGIKASFIEEQAFGESNPATMEGDGVKSQQNRRVIIKYKR